MQKSGTFYKYGDGVFSMYVTVLPQTCKSAIWFIHHSGRILATYSGPIMMVEPFTLEHHPNLTSRLLLLKKKSLFFFWIYFCKFSVYSYICLHKTISFLDYIPQWTTSVFAREWLLCGRVSFDHYHTVHTALFFIFYIGLLCELPKTFFGGYHSMNLLRILFHSQLDFESFNRAISILRQREIFIDN